MIPSLRSLRVAALSVIGISLGVFASTEREALRQLCADAEGGNAVALYRLAYLHDIGYDSIPRDTVISTRLYRESAEKGYLPAQNYLGFRLIKGEGVPRDVGNGLEWLRKAAVAGDAKAANNLGWLLMDGSMVERDYENAAFWLNKAAESGLPVAMSQLGDLYRNGWGVPADTLHAVELYSRAIEGGLLDAELKLIDLEYPRWERLSVADAVATGKNLYSHGAHRGAAILLDMAIANDAPGSDISALADAYTLMAEEYTLARGVGYDHDKGLEYYLKGGVLGNEKARVAIAELLEILPDAIVSYYPEITRFAISHGVTPPSEKDFSDPAYWLDQP